MLTDAAGRIASHVSGAIQAAARATGANFEYLLKTAQRESNFDPSAKARTSSATGLFQFIEQTWLQTLKSAGPALGYAHYAEGIERSASGRYVVTDPAARREILDLRKDPQAASAMAGAFTQRNAEILQSRLGRPPSEGELYIAHFLGANGAVRLISMAENNPRANAAEMFPSAAAANRPIFHRRGAPRTAAQVYDVLVAKHDRSPVPRGTPAGVPQAAPVVAAQAAAGLTPAETVASRWPKAGPSALAPAVPAAAAMAYAEPAAAEPPATLAAEAGPVFHGLFRTAGAAPVSAFVSELWGARNVHDPQRIAAAARGAEPVTESPQRPAGPPLDLFRFLRPGGARSNG